MKNQLKKAVLKTVAYADIFAYPLSLKQLHLFLIEQQISWDHFQKADFKNSLLQEKNGFYFLKGKQNLVKLRAEKEKISQKKLSLAIKKANWLKVIPSIRMVGLTGNLAMRNAQDQDDIDLLIVTKAGGLWLTRLLTVLFLDFFNWRRLPGQKKVKDKICLNMFLDESHLQIPKAKQNLFTAHEVVQLKPLWERDNLYQKFIKQNLWVKKFLPNWSV